MQHGHIVVGFQQHEIARLKLHFHRFGKVAKIGRDGDLARTGAYAVAHGIGGVVRNVIRFDEQIVNIKP